MKRIYHRFDLWEDYKFGMWRKVSFKEEKYFLDAAIVFTGDAELYGKYMIRAINEWPYGCEHNLSCTGMNRQAWIGHAATCIAIYCPEYITRLAWHQLTQKQQDDANEKADIAIKTWEDNYAKDKDWNRRIDSRPSSDFMDVRHIREDIPFFQCREGQYGDATLGSGGSEKKKKNVWPFVDRHGKSIQTNDGSCNRLF